VKTPLLPLALFRSPTFAGTNLLTLFLYAALGGALFFFPFNLIQVQGYNTTAAGAAMLPMILLMFFLSSWAGGLVTRYGAKLPLVVGPFIVAVGYILFAVPGIGGSYWLTYFPAVLLLGLGMSISVAPLTTAVMGSVDTERAGIASGINNAVARAASLLAIAVLGIVMAGIFNQQLDTHLTTIPMSTDARQEIDQQRAKLVDIEVPTTLQPEVVQETKQAIKESFLSGFRIIMFCAAALSFASAICALLLVEGKKPTHE
jgi:MFS family permease